MNILDWYTIYRLKRNYKKGIMFPPILVTEHATILDGGHRVIAARELGVPITAYVLSGEIHELDPDKLMTWLDK